MRRRQSIGSIDSVVDRVLDQQEKYGLTTHQVTLLAGVTIKGGSDTTASVLSSTIQALVTNPMVLKKAQAEIDAVVGEDRTPTWDDYEKLPYIAAMVKESHRWRPVAPLAVPHALSEGKSCSISTGDAQVTLTYHAIKMRLLMENYCRRGQSSSSTSGVSIRTNPNSRIPTSSIPTITKTVYCWLPSMPILPTTKTATTTDMVRFPPPS